LAGLQRFFLSSARIGKDDNGFEKASNVDFFSFHSRAQRRWLLFGGTLLIAIIALVDASTPGLPLGYLYLIPILLVSGFLSRPWIIVIVFACATLTGVLSHYHINQALPLFVMALAGFSGTGLFVSEMVQNRQAILSHVQEMQNEIRLRHETEEQLRGLVESSPLAIIVVGAHGKILLANDAAQNLFAPGESSILDQSIAEFLPILQTVIQQPQPRSFRTQIRCRGRRTNGEVFLAAVWFSTSETVQGPIVEAIIIDFSEDLRDREDLSLDHLLKNAKILVGAIAHEIRNLCGAVLVVHKNLSRLPDLRGNEDFRALGNLIEGLERLSAMELQPSIAQGLASVELSSVLDELRVVTEPTYGEAGMNILWRIQDDLPLVIGDRYGLQQVFLNLVRNSQRAMEMTESKQLTISSLIEPNFVIIRFEDTGVGISDPSELFQPFQQSAGATGLGLYVSRAILRSFGGELKYEPRSEGCCFAVSLTRIVRSGEIHE
jgi:PAS domain S-box-containing protein